MIMPMAIVFFSGALPPLLGELGTLVPVQKWLERLAARTFPFAAAFAAGIITSLALRDVDYNSVSTYGHFWRGWMPWEK